ECCLKPSTILPPLLTRTDSNIWFKDLTAMYKISEKNGWGSFSISSQACYFVLAQCRLPQKNTTHCRHGQERLREEKLGGKKMKVNLFQLIAQ
ncbi:MAG TPA: hypothetical protein PKZ90_14405, partial [Chitinophagaceae bacterium]|nr:hypothetical protein [Chitinophagaceae bacterium]